MALWKDRIEVNPKVMVGKPVIRGTRITVELILEQLATGHSTAEILEDYPQLTQEDVQAALAYAAQAIGTDEILFDLEDAPGAATR